MPPIALALAVAADSWDAFPGPFALAFAGGWALVTTLIAAYTGHMRLLSAYPPINEPVTQSFWLASGTVRGVPFQSALHVSIGARGLHFAPSWLFRPLTHRGIPCIPWGELRCIRAQSEPGEWISRWSRFEVPGVGVRFEVLGKAGRAVEAALAGVTGAK